MVGLPVAPERPSSSIRRPNRPERSCSRSMSSSQTLCPSAFSSSNGLVIVLPPSFRMHSAETVSLLPWCVMVGYLYSKEFLSNRLCSTTVGTSSYPFGLNGEHFSISIPHLRQK